MIRTCTFLATLLWLSAAAALAGLCADCSDGGPSGVGTCEKCGRPIAVPATAPDEGNVEPAVLRSDKWEYSYTTVNFGQPSERRTGQLIWDGRPIRGAEFLDRIDTPWGQMQLCDDLHNRGWLPRRAQNLAIEASRGRLLPHPLAAERSRRLREDINSFKLILQHLGPTDKPFYHLTLSAGQLNEQQQAFQVASPIEPATAELLIDRLLASGWLAEALPNRPPARMSPESAYVLRVETSRLTLSSNLGWDLNMLAMLDNLRGPLPDRAGGKFDQLRNRLAGLRESWTEQLFREGRLGVGMHMDTAVRMLKAARAEDISDAVSPRDPLGPNLEYLSQYYLMPDRTCLHVYAARWSKAEPLVVAVMERGQPGRGYGDLANWRGQVRTRPASIDLAQLAQRDARKTAAIRITIRADGGYAVDNKTAADLEKLEEMLCEIEHPQTREVELDADKKVPFARIDAVLKLLGRVGFREISVAHD